MINETFKNNLDSIGVELTDRQFEQFDMYYNLLVEWNSFMNLTGITDYDEVLAACAIRAGAEADTARKILDCVTTEAALDILKKSDMERMRFLLLMLEQVQVFRDFH